MPEFKDGLELPEIEKAKNLFKSDYVNEFVGLDVALQALKSGDIDIETFKNQCIEFASKKQGKLVLKFGERYNGVSVPKLFETEIEEIHALADQINMWGEELIKEEKSKNIDELAELVKKVNNIFEAARKKKIN